MQTTHLITPTTQKSLTTLHQTFQTLPTPEQTVLIILAVIFKPIGAAKLSQVISILHARGILTHAKKEYVLSPQRKGQLANLELLTPNREGMQLNKLLANQLIAHIAQLETQFEFTDQEKLLEIIMAAEEVVPVINSYSWQKKEQDNQRVLRDLFFLNQISTLEQELAFNKNPQIIDHAKNSVLIDLLFLPFHLPSFLRLPASMQYQAFASLFRACQLEGTSCGYAIQLLEQVCAAGAGDSDDDNAADNTVQPNQNCVLLLAEQYLYQMRFNDFNKLQVAQYNNTYSLQLQGAYAFLCGQNAQAIALYQQALVAKNKLSKRKNQYLNELLGYFYKLALIVEANQSDVSYFAAACDQVEFENSDRKVRSELFNVGRMLLKPIRCLQSAKPYKSDIHYNCTPEQTDFFSHHMEYFGYLLGNVWCNQSRKEAFKLHALRCQASFEQLDYALFGLLSEQLAASFANQPPSQHALLINITTLIERKSEWDVALDKLIALNPKTDALGEAAEQKPEKELRLIWELHQQSGLQLVPREQKRIKSGWSKGRVVSLKRLKEQTASFDYLSEADIAICQSIDAFYGGGYYGKTEYALDTLRSLKAAVGMPNLYKENDLDHPIELIQREPELLVSQQGEQLCLSIADLSGGYANADYDDDGYDEDFDDDADYNDYTSGVDRYAMPNNYTYSNGTETFSLKAISTSQYQLTVFSPEHMKVAQIIGEGGLLIPISAKQKALEGIAAVAPFLNIQSNVNELDTGLENTPCDPHLVVNIEPIQNGLSFTCMVMPFGEDGPAFKPAQGNTSISADINNKRVLTQRDLLREEMLLDLLDQACPAFLNMPENVLSLSDYQEALEVLEQLEAAVSKSAFALLLRWPKGKKIKLSKTLESQHMQLALSKKHEWFDVSGQLHTGEGEDAGYDDSGGDGSTSMQAQIIELRKLLELVSTSNGRFIALDSNHILALSSDLRHKLEQINAVAGKGKFHPLASLMMQEATTGMRMKTIHAWDEQTKKMHEANAIEPVLPATFQGELRDYQHAGFDWAMRLAHWGAGACLADDMGLGKTLQALAVLLSRAANGPSLVLAPTSVCFNWQQEALKFAPTLNIHVFANAITYEQRAELLNKVSAFDCVIISYGLLQRETELLQAVHWHTIVADEAQALKNPIAKRTKAACALKGDFKMITTGTPIENDLTELWSLFRFINPGLLGNLKTFTKEFSQPIENVKEDKLAAHKASQSLKSLIQPFILRRMKNQVLTELPSRTNINIPVSMSTKERAFYEALRLNAIDNISQSSQQANAGEQRIRMLAELVKLRQACCHPKLILAESDIPSAKLEALDELLQELKLNKHKTLIFSQFVGHLQLIKQHIESKAYSYQYLDGSTPQKERQKRVNAFQNGEGDIFLISLKAGGSGLNLTAADHVIHMDPWWNPAVEEQASDRAHRMGQIRPVTIYRLIAQNTIEEKIVALHQHKRDLADKLLEGNEVASKLSVDDMLVLLKDTF